MRGARYHDCLGKGRARWLVVRHFNKPIAPDLRVAVVAADAETAERMRREQWLADGWISGFLQKAAAAALASRAIQSLLGRARRTYALRRSALLQALAERGIEAHGASGLNVWVPVPDEAAVVRGLLERGWCVRAGARYRIRSAPAVRILMPEESERLADDVRAVLRQEFLPWHAGHPTAAPTPRAPSHRQGAPLAPLARLILRATTDGHRHQAP